MKVECLSNICEAPDCFTALEGGGVHKTKNPRIRTKQKKTKGIPHIVQLVVNIVMYLFINED